MLQAQRRVLVALVALVALAVGALAADKEVSKPLDLNTVKAHDEQKDVSSPRPPPELPVLAFLLSSLLRALAYALVLADPHARTHAPSLLSSLSPLLPCSLTRHGENGIATCMQTSIPQFAAQEALQQLNASITACYLQLGPKAEIDGVGGCGCTRGFVVSGECRKLWLPAPAYA